MKAEITSGSVEDVSSVLFEYRLPSGTGDWLAIPAANANHPNPDFTPQWAVHWDVTSLPEDFCDIRAVARDLCGIADAGPTFITVQIDHHQPEVRGFMGANAETVQNSLFGLSQENAIATMKEGSSITVRLEIEGSSLISSCRCSMSWLDTTTFPT